MFLLHSIFVMVVVYWVSALIAEIVMTSKVENSLAPSIRVGFGFLISIVYFSASWLLMSLSQSWILGIFLLVLYGLGKSKFLLGEHKLLKLLFFGRRYLRSFGLFLLGAMVFFIPLIVSNHYGPFTEGGGDISIYSDTAKYFQDNQLTELGLESKTFSDVINNLKEVFSPQPKQERWKLLNERLLNPPAAEVSIYRVVILRSMNSFFYTPYAAYGFLSKDTNYPVYFGIQVFFYLCLLSGVGVFFRQFGMKLAIFAVLFVFMSHSVVSVFYNMYGMQAVSLSAAALILAILPTIRLLSLAGLRTYGSALLIIWLSYIHFLSVLLPLIVAVALFRSKTEIQKNVDSSKPVSLLNKGIMVFFIGLCLLTIWVGSIQSLLFLKKLLLDSFAGTMDAGVYMGDQASIFSLRWFSFLFGFLSQQHFSPFVIELPLINIIIKIGIVFALIALAMGAVIMRKIYKTSFKLNDRRSLFLIIYVVGILTLIIQFYLARVSLYTQAKGAQNVLIYLYVVLLLPLGVGLLASKEGFKIRSLIYLLSTALAIFMTSLGITKIIYTAKLILNHDRSTILEASYFSEAKKIREKDPDAFVLFEPNKSADVYISIQPFFGAKMVSTRHLIISKVAFHEDPSAGEDERVLWTHWPILPSDLIEIKDLPHLWVLDAHCKSKLAAFPISDCQWKAEKVAESKVPVLLLFGSQYEKNFGERILSKDSNLNGMFSYVRKGSAMIFLPQGEGKLEVIMEPRSEMDYPSMLKEVSQRVEKEEFGKFVKLTSDGQRIKLIYQLPAVNSAFLKLIARFDGEYWLNVRLNNHEIS